MASNNSKISTDFVNRKVQNATSKKPEIVDYSYDNTTKCPLCEKHYNFEDRKIIELDGKIINESHRVVSGGKVRHSFVSEVHYLRICPKCYKTRYVISKLLRILFSHGLACFCIVRVLLSSESFTFLDFMCALLCYFLCWFVGIVIHGFIDKFIIYPRPDDIKDFNAFTNKYEYREIMQKDEEN